MTTPNKIILKNQYGEESINYVLPGSTAISGLPNSVSTLTAVGATVIPASNFKSGITKRTGATADFIDTTDTAVAIFAAIPAATAGQTFKYSYQNATQFQATISQGSGVTLANAVVPPASVANFLVTLTSATAVSITLLNITPLNGVLPAAKYSTGTTTGTFTAGQLTGANFNAYKNTNATPGTILTRTAAQIIADVPDSYVGQTFVTRIMNTGAGTLTLGGGAAVTITGTATVAQNTWTDFLFTISTVSAVGVQNIGSGSIV